MNHQLSFVLGTRPEIIKLSPVIRACQQADIEFTVIHTGQHYSESLDDVFFDTLELPPPDYNLEVGSGTHGAQTGRMLVAIEEILQREEPDTVIVQGDTNSALAGGIAASKLDSELGHVEAGLRSFDREMPEELNRILLDHASRWLFAPTERAADRLRTEAIPEDRIALTGNTIVDAVLEYKQLAAAKSEILRELGVEDDEFVLLTAHRAANVDDPDRFENLLAGVDMYAQATRRDVIYPIHPRSRQTLEEHDLTVPDRIQPIEPVDFLDFLRLEEAAALIFTDSGGVQEEACILGTPCVTLRDNTERPETLTVGSNTLAGTEPDAIFTAALDIHGHDGDWETPFGDGDAARRILGHLDVELPREIKPFSR